MVFIDCEDNVMGSKRFTDAVAEVLRPHLQNFLNDEEIDIFNCDYWTTMVHFGYWSAEAFMEAFNVLQSAIFADEFQNQHSMLLEFMKKDPRYSEDN